jgi:Mlc titration factor MtfA (ptsG expression regulator)
VADSGLSGHETWQVGNLLHEIGHNLDGENPNWNGFLALSGWKKVEDPQTPPTQGYTRIAAYDETWEYKTNSALVSEYAKSHPHEDFAESFAAYFLQKAGLQWSDGRPNQGKGAAAIPTKITFIENWVNGLKQTSS